MNVGGNFIMENYCLNIPRDREVSIINNYKNASLFLDRPLLAIFNVIVV